MLSAVFSIRAWKRNESLGGLGSDVLITRRPQISLAAEPPSLVSMARTPRTAQNAAEKERRDGRRASARWAEPVLVLAGVADELGAAPTALTTLAEMPRTSGEVKTTAGHVPGHRLCKDSRPGPSSTTRMKPLSLA